MQPGPDERLAGGGLALGDLVLVVREDRSTPPVWMSKTARGAAMLIAEHSICQPGRPGPTPSSHDGSPGFGALPEREVADIVLAVLVGLDPLADPELLGIEPRQAAVGGPRAMRKKIEPSSVR